MLIKQRTGGVHVDKAEDWRDVVKAEDRRSAC